VKIALIGNGAIAKLVTQYCADRPDRFALVGALGLTADRVSVGTHPVVYKLDEFLAFKPDLVVECAGHSAVASYAVPLLERGIDQIIVSTGSLADAALWEKLKDAAGKSTAKIALPAGALPGVDALSAAKFAGLARVTLCSSKPPRAWKGTPAETVNDLDSMTASTVIFSGNAREAALTYPKNANVAATAALAGAGFENTKVELVADPGSDRNTHHLEAEGAFGRMTLTINASPSPDNPKTSYIAALSILRLLDNQTAGIAI
jgi:aspartate dehydrogenase